MRYILRSISPVPKMVRWTTYAYVGIHEVHRRDTANDFMFWSDFNFSSFLSWHQRCERFLVIRVPDQSVEPFTISHNRISKGVESAKRLHRYLNFADDGNHARSTLQLHVSSGFCASVTLRSGVTQRGGQDRVLFVNLYPQDLLQHLFTHFSASLLWLSFLHVSVN